jgi:hypothetical protein
MYEKHHVPAISSYSVIQFHVRAAWRLATPLRASLCHWHQKTNGSETTRLSVARSSDMMESLLLPVVLRVL